MTKKILLINPGPKTMGDINMPMGLLTLAKPLIDNDYEPVLIDTRVDDLDLKQLDYFRCTEQYHNVMGSQVTDGIIYLMENGYSWFITDCLAVIRYEDKVKKETSLIYQILL